MSICADLSRRSLIRGLGALLAAPAIAPTVLAAPADAAPAYPMTLWDEMTLIRGRYYVPVVDSAGWRVFMPVYSIHDPLGVNGYHPSEVPTHAAR